VLAEVAEVASTGRSSGGRSTMSDDEDEEEEVKEEDNTSHSMSQECVQRSLRNNLRTLVSLKFPLRCRSCLSEDVFNKVDYYVVRITEDYDEMFFHYSTYKGDTEGFRASDFVKHDIWHEGVSPDERLNNLEYYTQVLWPDPEPEWINLNHVISTDIMQSRAPEQDVQQAHDLLIVKQSERCNWSEARAKLAAEGDPQPFVESSSKKRARHGPDHMSYSEQQEGDASSSKRNASVSVSTSAKELVGSVLDQCDQVSLNVVREVLQAYQDPKKKGEKIPAHRLKSILDDFTPQEVTEVLKMRGAKGVKGSSIRQFLSDDGDE